MKATAGSRWQFIGEVLLLAALVGLATFQFGYGYSETDTMACARHGADPSWLANDWYLDLHIAYRWCFDQVFGHLMIWLGDWPGIVTGRVLTYVLFALACRQLIRAAQVPFTIGALIVLAYVAHPSIASGEWMTGGGLETKTIAWPFALMAIHAAMRERWHGCWAFLGAALTFHVLVGLFTGYALVLTTLLVHRSRMWTIFKAGWTLLLTGIPGLIAVVMHAFEGPRPGSAEAWNIYVDLRVPHHTLPRWAANDGIELSFWLIVHLLLLRSTRNGQGRWRVLSVISLFYLSLTAIGLVIWSTGHHEFLRFYWFRPADATLRLLGPLAIIAWLLTRPAVDRWSKMWPRLFPPVLGLVLLGIAGVIAGRTSLAIIFGPKPIGAVVEKNSVFDPEMAGWIEDHTPPDVILITPPDVEDIYLSCDRAIVVDFKHSPQKAADVLKWHERLMRLNGGKELEGAGFQALPGLNRNYEALSAGEIEAIAADYGADGYLSRTLDRADLPLLHRTDHFALYGARPHH